MNRRSFLAALGATSLAGLANAQESAPQAAPTSGATRFHVQFTGPETCDVCWWTAAPTTGSVRWHQGDGAWQSAVAARDGLVCANTCNHCVTLRGVNPAKPLILEASSQRCQTFEPYRIVLGPESLCAQANLRPWVGEAGLSLAIFNDLHGRVDLVPRLLDSPEVAAAKPAIALFNGDCADDCQSPAGLDQRFLRVLPEVLARGITPLILRGNHEYRGVMARHLREYVSPLAGGRYYGAFTLGPVRFLCLDTGEDKPDGHPVYGGLLASDAYVAEEAAWLQDELASEAWREARWRVAVGHIPPFSHNEEDDAWHGPTRLRQLIAPLLAKPGTLKAMICGHNHAYALHPACADHAYPILVGGGPSEGAATATLLQATEERLTIHARTLAGACPGGIDLAQAAR